MKRDGSPYVAHCSFCRQGMLRLARCEQCGIVVALCDECELIWQDVPAVKQNPSLPSDSTYPICPGCMSTKPRWFLLRDKEAIRLAKLEAYVVGESD